MSERINVTRSSMPSYEEYCEEIRDLWDSRWLTNMGEKHERLQRALAQYLEVETVQLLTNGHMAIELSMQALGLQGEVITTPFTFASTTHAIVRSGLTPVFCDINSEDFTLNASQIEQLITEKTCAILPVHVYGNICQVEKIEQIANRYHLKVIYDAAHAFGVRYKGCGIANWGDASCFSFHATKVFHTIEGGAVCFRREAYRTKLSQLRNFGINGEDSVDEIGTNGKMSEFCAAMGLCNLKHIKDEFEKRKIAAVRYRTNLSSISGLYLNPIQANVETNYAYFPVIIDPVLFGGDRDRILAELKENGVIGRKYFYPLTNAYACFQGKYCPEQTPVALETSRKVLTLPLYADLSLTDVDRICEIILSSRNKGVKQ